MMDMRAETEAKILKALAEIGGPTTAKEVAERAGLSVYTVRKRMRDLINAGLVTKSGRKYVITEEGKKKVESGG